MLHHFPCFRRCLARTPYSFKESLRAQNQLPTEQIMGQKLYDQLIQQLKNYLQNGGFPGAFAVPEARRRELLQSYVDIVITRDIVERYGITHISLLKYMIKSLLKNTGTPFAINKFHNDIKSQGLSAAKNTLYDYLEYIGDAYLSFMVPLYSESIRKSHTNPRKVYAIDPGTARAYSFGINQNFGHLFETMIYLDLRRTGHQIYYHLTPERYEIDFLAIDRFGVPKLYQVAWDTSNEKTLQREMRALEIAKKELGMEGELITPKTYIEKLQA